MKKLLCIVLALVLVLSCAACGGSKDVTITFWAVPFLEETVMQAYIDEFEAANEGITVELEYQTYEGIGEKLQMALSSGDTPDVYLDGAARTASLPTLGDLVPVDDLMDEIGGWYDSVMTFGVKDGSHYLIPASQMSGSFVSVNVSLAKELGIYDMLPEDRISWTVQDFYEFCKAATEAGADQGIKGTCLYAGSSTSDDIMYSFLMSNGGQIIDKENNICVANSAACVEAVEVLGNIVKDGYAMDGAAMLTGGDTITPFLNQQYVVIINQLAPNLMTQFAEMKDEGYIDEVPEVRLYGVPTAEGGTMDSACWGANGIAIFNNDDEAKATAAKKFVAYLMTETSFTQDLWTAAPSYHPSRDGGEAFTHENKLIEEEVVSMQQMSTQYADFDFGLLESYWPEVRNYFYPEMQAVYSGEKTAQEAMDSFAANVDEILANQ